MSRQGMMRFASTLDHPAADSIPLLRRARASRRLPLRRERLDLLLDRVDLLAELLDVALRRDVDLVQDLVDRPVDLGGRGLGRLVADALAALEEVLDEVPPVLLRELA